MQAGARLVNLSSAGHRFADVDLDDPNFERTPYEPFVAYGRSKTANILFAVEFDRRHKERGVRATAVHPGGIQTELGRHMDAEALQKLIASIDERELAAGGQAAVRVQDRSRRARRRRSGRAWSRRPTRSAGAIARTAMSPSSSRDGHHRPRRRAPLRARSRARQGAVGEERGDGRRAFPRANRSERPRFQRSHSRRINFRRVAARRPPVLNRSLALVEKPVMDLS